MKKKSGSQWLKSVWEFWKNWYGDRVVNEVGWFLTILQESLQIPISEAQEQQEDSALLDKQFYSTKNVTCN